MSAGELTRRGLIGGLIAIAAPAIVPVRALMPLRGVPLSSIDPIEGVIIETLGGHLSERQRDRIYQLMAGLKRDGLWNKLDNIWLFKDEPVLLRHSSASDCPKA